MKQILKALGLLLGLLPAFAAAQTLPNLPANTVYGRQGVGTGPGQAIPFDTLATRLFGAGVDTNTLNSRIANYTIQTTDCGKTVQAGTGSTGIFTVTLPAVTGFSSTCALTVINGDSARGKRLSGFPSSLTSPSILWPRQSISLKIVNGAWVASDPGRYVKASLTLNVAPSVGSDTNDGLATGSGNALQTLAKCVNIANTLIDTQSNGNGGVTCLVPSTETVQETVQVFFPMVGGGSVIFQGSGGAFTWKPTNSSMALQIGDFGTVGLTNVNFSSAGVTTPLAFIYGHQNGFVDVNAGVSFTPTVTITNGITCDSDTHFNINSGLTVNAGTFATALFNGCQGSSWNINGAQTFVGTPTLTRYGIFTDGARAILQGNVTFTGATAGSAMLAANNAVILNQTGFTPPNGAIVTFTGGLNCTAAATCAANIPRSMLSDLGTGVGTALGVNVGSAGAPVLFNGALGTPSSGNVTSALPAHTGDCTSSAGAVALSCNKTLGSATTQISINLGTVNFNSANTDTVITVPAGVNASAFALGSIIIYNCTGSITTATFEVFSATAGGGTALTALTTGTITAQGPLAATSLQQVNNTFTGWLNQASLYFRNVVAQGTAVTCTVSARVNYL